MKRLLLFAVATLLVARFPAAAVPVRNGAVEAELISEVKSIKPGATFWVAVRLKMDPLWHTYWKNPGDAGMRSKVAWELPPGFQAGELQWPTPTRLEEPPLVNFGYEGEIYLLNEITAPATLAPGTSVDLAAKVSWLMCKDQCIPGKASLKLTMPVEAAQAPDAGAEKIFSDTRSKIPAAAAGGRCSFSVSGDSILLKIASGPEPVAESTSLYFFPEDRGVIENSAPQSWTRDGAAFVLKLQQSHVSTSEVTTLRGVLVGLEKDRALAIEAAREGIQKAAPAPVAAATSSVTLWSGLLGMFLGGMILNLMPCVFPVLSLKIVGFVEQAREEHGSAARHAAAFVAGVMVSMWILAALLLSLRGHGSHVGWAFQMSSPGFVLGLIFLFLVLGLNMFGLFEMGLAMTGVGGGLQSRKGLSGSFFSGLLTTVAGAPCAGPFLGTAIGFALAQSNAVAMLAFTAMGLGTAAPYAILSSFPGLLRFIPRPGAWMETMKQLMGFPMLATAAWFAGTFAKLHGGIDALIQLLFGAVLVGMAFWALGKWGALHRSNTTRWIARVAAVALVAAGWHTAMAQSELVFESWSAEKVAALRKEGRPVFVDFTADWCAICQVNKRVAVENKDVVQKFKDLGVTVLMADWTDQNEAVTKGLQEFDRAAVPFYILYGRDPQSQPVVLPQALTPGILLEALEKKVGKK